MIPDVNEFIRNTSAHTLEELAPYQEQQVAWSVDGKRILAHAPDLAKLYEAIDRKGITEYVIGFIPAADVSYCGGGLD